MSSQPEPACISTLVYGKDAKGGETWEVEGYNDEVLEPLLGICLPLFRKFSISVFEYSHIFNDGTLIYISTCPEWHKMYLKCHARTSFITNHIRFVFRNKKSYHVWDSNYPALKDKDLEFFIQSRKQHAICHDFTIYKHHPTSLESWSFAATEQDELRINFYLNNLDILNGFILYFNEQACKIINKAKKLQISDQDPFFSNQDSEPSIEEEQKLQFMEEVRIKEYPLLTPKGIIYLSRREIQCLSYKSKGKTAKEIAKKLTKKNTDNNVNHRTVEVYFRNITQKARNQPMSIIIESFLESPLSNLPLGEL